MRLLSELKLRSRRCGGLHHRLLLRHLLLRHLLLQPIGPNRLDLLKAMAQQFASIFQPRQMKTKSGKKVRVVIADDHAIVRRGLVGIMGETSDLELVGQAENGHELLALIAKQKPDVVVMDINMPQKSGWDVMLQLKQEKQKIPV